MWTVGLTIEIKLPFQFYPTHVFKFLQCSVDGKHLIDFQSETSVFKFLLGSVDGKHLIDLQSETSVFKFLH